jgi:hypothetical protein
MSSCEDTQMLQIVQKEAKAGVIASMKKEIFACFSLSDIEGHWFESIHAKVPSGHLQPYRLQPLNDTCA